MNGRILLVLPLAALLLGTPVETPSLQRPLPLLRLHGCDYQLARAFFLQAYGYKEEQPAVALQLLAGAEAERKQCQGDSTLLAMRITKLRASLLSIKNFPRPLPAALQ